MPSLRIVATVAETTHRALCVARDREARRADLVELRLDALREPIDVARALHGCTKPMVVTCRPKREGGLFEGGEHERREILRAAIAGGADYVDVEWRSGLDDLVLARRGEGIVLSMHDFEGIPGDLETRLKAMLAEGTEVVKVAVAVQRLSDCARLARAAAVGKGRALALVGMGVPGIVTRLLPARFGSRWTYAGSAAPGQLSTELMLDTYRVRDVRPSTAVYGVAGQPIASSLSPAMHNAWFDAAGADAVYFPFETASADDLLDFAEWLPIAGLSVTAPLKREIFERVADRDALADRVGAVNTIKHTSHGWAATNTDVGGFLAPLAARNLRLRGRRASILGAGGAARAVAVALAGLGAVVSVHSRRLPSAQEVAALASGVASDRWPLPGTWDLLVNAAPAGWQSSVGLIGPACAGAWVYDLVSTPALTPLVAEAAAAGCHTISGLEMLVAQGEAQAEWWTGSRPGGGVMMDAARRTLNADGAPADTESGSRCG